MTLYTVTTDVSKVYPIPLGHDVLLYNLGSNTVYASEYESNGISQGFPILAGNSSVWDGNKRLYLYTGSGVSLFAVDPNVKNVFDLATLASAISVSLTGGGTLTNAGIAQAIYNQGNKSADIVAVLANSSVVQTNAQNSFFDFDLGDSAYYAVKVQFGSATADANDHSVVQVSIQWWLDAAKTVPIDYTNHGVYQQASYAPAGTMGNHPNYAIQGKAPSRYFTLGLLNNGATYGSTTNYMVFSHTGQIPERIVRTPGKPASAMVAALTFDRLAFQGVVAAGATIVDYPSSRNGLAILNVLCAAVTTNFLAVTVADTVGQLLAEVSFPVSTNGRVNGTVQFYVPNSYPIKITYSNISGAGIQIYGSITQDWSV